jgi:hypothetical protein
MTLPVAKFSYSPLGGKAPLTINFINESQNLGGLNEWESCLLNKKYHISYLDSLNDIFALDFSQWIEEGIKQTYNINGFKLESNGVYFPNFLNEPNNNPIKVLENYPIYPNNANTYPNSEWIGNIDNIINKLSTEQINIDLTKDFEIEITVEEFNNYHGSIQLYFESLSVNDNSYAYNPGIHINVGNGDGTIRSIINNRVEKIISNYELPLKIKLIKDNDTLSLYANNNQIDSIAADDVGVGKRLDDSYDNARNLLCPLKIKVSTQNNISNWCMHIKNIYIITTKEDNNSNIIGICKGSPAQYLWGFDDGSTSTEQNPIKNFVNDDIYDVSLTTINENGSNTITKKIEILSSGTEVENASEIFRNKNEEIVRNLDTIPDYCSNVRLKDIINEIIYDSIRNADSIQGNITAELKITVDKTINNNRNIRCETSFISDLIQNEGLNSINNEHVVRTLVEPNKQSDIINVIFDLPDPE